MPLIDPFLMKESNITPGNLIIWDLKTATKVQLIDAHKPYNVSAVAFNKNASASNQRRSESDFLLATYSMEDGKVKFWQQHSGFLSAITSISQVFQHGLDSSRSPASRPGTGSGEDSGFLQHLAGGGLIKSFREFRVEHIALASPIVTPPQKLLDIAGEPTQGRRVSAQLVQLLQQVRFEWVGERKVVLHRIDPYPALTFSV